MIQIELLMDERERIVFYGEIFGKSSLYVKGNYE
jgi:hypothetical protein